MTPGRGLGFRVYGFRVKGLGLRGLGLRGLGFRALGFLLFRFEILSNWVQRCLAGFGPRMSRAVTASVVCGARVSGPGCGGFRLRGSRV